MSNAIDLVTLSYATTALAASGVVMTTARTAILPQLITAASLELQRETNRRVAAQSYDEVLVTTIGRPDRGESPTVKLSWYPVNTVTRVSGGRSSALLIVNGDQSTNQIARVQIVSTGDDDYSGGLSFTGITLTTIASATTSTMTFTFAAYPTLNAMAAAINAYGNGWTATVQGNFGLWPSTELYGAREPKPGFTPGCQLDIFGSDLASASVDRPSGIVRTGYTNSMVAGWNSPYGGSWDDTDIGSDSNRQQVRVTYNAGYATIPAEWQQFCIEVIKALYERLSTDSTLASESAGTYSYATRAAINSLPDAVLKAIRKQKDYRV